MKRNAEDSENSCSPHVSSQVNIFSCVRGLPCLWDRRHVHYKNREEHKTVWDTLGKKYNNVGPSEVKRKRQNLRTQFWKDHKQIKAISYSL